MSVRAILGVMLTGAFVGLIFLLAWQGKTDTQTFNLLVGAMTGAALGHVLGFYFGTTQSSNTKDDTINALSGGAAAPVAVEPTRVPGQGA
jgi:ABC-type uncharacterized transport system permease subunit